MLTRLPRVGGLDYVRTMLEPASSLVENRFASEAGGLLFAGNAMHADIPMTARGSGLFGLLLAMLAQTVGFPVPEGGAGQLAQALVRRFTAHGGRTPARHPRGPDQHVQSSRHWCHHGDRRAATGPRRCGRRVGACPVRGLVPWSELPERVRRRMARFEQDPSTIKVDWAPSGPVPWIQQPSAAPRTVHIADSVDQLTTTQDMIHTHLIPAKPFLLVGQMTTADPTRSPQGTEALWAYTHVPLRVRADEAEELTGEWDDAEPERFADRMQARLEQYAPGLASTVRARRVLGPHQLQERNENLINGALGGGTAGLHQKLIFRPIPGLGRAETPIRGLFLGSASRTRVVGPRSLRRQRRSGGDGRGPTGSAVTTARAGHRSW